MAPSLWKELNRQMSEKDDKRGVTGRLTVNEDNRNEDLFRKQSCYIMQDDNLQPLLTVSEAMSVAANLKLSSQLKEKDRKKRIEEVLKSMSLWEHKGVKSSALSGGQKKRLSMALELIKNPQFLFFDEPTSGLDSVTSKQCVMLLKQLAMGGKTVICTIHQPSAVIFEMFDHLYAVADGKCIYQGSIKGLIPYLAESELVCPTYHNPADYLLEVASGEYGNYNDILVEKSANGLNLDWRKTQRNSWQMQALEHVENMMQSGRITPVRAAPIYFPTVKKNEPVHVTETTHCCDRHYPTSFCNQLVVLLRRNFLILSRDMTLTYSRIATHAAIAMFIGILYFGIGEDASNTLNNFNYLFFSIIFLQFTAFNCVTTTFPSELPIITREHFNRWYSLKSYYLSVTFADIPIQILATLIYVLVTYFMTKQPTESFRLLLFLVMCVLVSLVAQSFGLFIGASMSIKNGVIFGPLITLPFTIFSGFFVQLNDAHPYLRWVFHMSFLKYGFEGSVLSIFGYDRGKLPCAADYCHFVYPEKFLDQMDMAQSEYYVAVLALLAIMLFVRICAFIALYLQIGWRK
ncbi:ABC subfamily G member 28 [Rhyzopertha dominica]|nr:ABC subfamily G member 28 [Rhyzopertha dominica]